MVEYSRIARHLGPNGAYSDSTNHKLSIFEDCRPLAQA